MQLLQIVNGGNNPPFRAKNKKKKSKGLIGRILGFFFFFFRDPHLVSGYNRKHRMIEIKVLKGVSLVPEQIYPCGDILSQ